MFDEVVVLQGEMRCWSVFGFKGVSFEEAGTTRKAAVINFKKHLPCLLSFGHFQTLCSGSSTLLAVSICNRMRPSRIKD